MRQIVLFEKGKYTSQQTQNVIYFFADSVNHQTLYILNQNHPGYLSNKDQTRHIDKTFSPP